jgi:hypothetical protein
LIRTLSSISDRVTKFLSVYWGRRQARAGPNFDSNQRNLFDRPITRTIELQEAFCQEL